MLMMEAWAEKLLAWRDSALASSTKAQVLTMMASVPSCSSAMSNPDLCRSPSKTSPCLSRTGFKQGSLQTPWDQLLEELVETKRPNGKLLSKEYGKAKTTLGNRQVQMTRYAAQD